MVTFDDEDTLVDEDIFFVEVELFFVEDVFFGVVLQEEEEDFVDDGLRVEVLQGDDDVSLDEDFEIVLDEEKEYDDDDDDDVAVGLDDVELTGIDVEEYVIDEEELKGIDVDE